VRIDRTPAPARRPLCYGRSYGREGLCASCPFASECRRVCAQWSGVLSLAEASQRALDAFRSSLADRKPDGTLYERVYADVYGRRPNPKSKCAYDYAMFQVVELCGRKGIDPAVYVRAQMESLRDAVQRIKVRGRSLGFQPNMLFGLRAMYRYEAFRSAAEKRYGAKFASAFSERGKLETMLVELTEAETEYGESLLSGARFSGPPLWSALRLEGASPEGRRIRRDYGSDVVDRMIRAAFMAAACAVANRRRAGLANRIGITTPDDVEWDDIIAAVRRYAPDCPRDLRSVNVVGEWLPGQA